MGCVDARTGLVSSIVCVCLKMAKCLRCLLHTPHFVYRFETIDEASVLAVQAGLLDYVKREYTQGDAEGQLFCQSTLILLDPPKNTE